MVIADGLGNYSTTDYSYDQGPWANATSKGYEFLGYGVAYALSRALSTDSNVLKNHGEAGIVTPPEQKRERWLFYTRTDGGSRDDVDPRHGRHNNYGIYPPNEANAGNFVLVRDMVKLKF